MASIRTGAKDRCRQPYMRIDTLENFVRNDFPFRQCPPKFVDTLDRVGHRPEYGCFRQAGAIGEGFPALHPHRLEGALAGRGACRYGIADKRPARQYLKVRSPRPSTPRARCYPLSSGPCALICCQVGSRCESVKMPHVMFWHAVIWHAAVPHKQE